MLKYYSIPDVPGIVVRKVKDIPLDQIQLPDDAVYIYYDETKKALCLWDGENTIELRAVYEVDEDFRFFCYVSELPFVMDPFV